MSFAEDTGYVPTSFAAVMEAVRIRLNAAFGTNFTADSFVGTNWYKYFYTLVQRLMENETKTSEIFLKLSQYISTTNQSIQRPSVSFPGLIDSFASKGYVVSLKPNLLVDAGTMSICVDVNASDPNYAAIKLELATNIKNFVAAGMVSLGTQVQSIVLSNGQAFDFKYYLPTYIPVKLRVTLTTSDNTLIPTPSDVEIRTELYTNAKMRYRLGWDFEPQRYFNSSDAPWAATVLVEWSSNGGSTWNSTVYEADFKDLFTFALSDVTVVVVP